MRFSSEAENLLIGLVLADDGKPAARMRFSEVGDWGPLENWLSQGGGIPLIRGQVNPGRPYLAPPGGSNNENSLVFIGRSDFGGPAAIGWVFP